MLTGEIRNQIDQIWNAFWSGGISNPLEVIEQITYLLFLKRLDEQETAEELKANREKKPMQKRFFPDGKDSKKRPYQDTAGIPSETSTRAICMQHLAGAALAKKGRFYEHNQCLSRSAHRSVHDPAAPLRKAKLSPRTVSNRWLAFSAFLKHHGI